MTGEPSHNARGRGVGRPALAVVRGLTYSERSQVFNRWALHVYQTAFRWTGNIPDAEDATEWVLLRALGRLPLPELVRLVDEQAVAATREAVSRHWSDRYGVRCLSRSEIHACEARRPITFEALLDDLSAEARLVLVLRFLRRRTVTAIMAQLHLRPATATVRMFSALTEVAQRIGFQTGNGQTAQADYVAAFVDDLLARRRPARFEVSQATWTAMVAATHLHAAVAGNNLPDLRFLRSLEQRLEALRTRPPVTHVRIWSA